MGLKRPAAAKAKQPSKSSKKADEKKENMEGETPKANESEDNMEDEAKDEAKDDQTQPELEPMKALEDKARDSASGRLETKPDPSEEGTERSLTAKQLMQHESFTKALQEYKAGNLTEDEFLSKWTDTQRQGLCKVMEKARKDNKIEGWENLQGPGVKNKKKKLLLQFLTTGKIDQAEIQQTTKGLNAVSNDKSNQWTSWKKITDEFGEEEAKLRLERGLLKARKDPEARAIGLTIWQFLKVKQKQTFKQGMEQETATSAVGKADAAQVACMAAAIQDGAEDGPGGILDDLWLGKKVGGDYKETWKALETEGQPMLCDDTDDEEPAGAEILAQLGCPASSNLKGKKASKESKALEKQKKMQEKAEKEHKKQEEKLHKFEQAVDACTDAGDKATGKKNLSKMATMLLKEVRAFKPMVAKDPADQGLKQSLEKLNECKDNVEEALVDGDFDVSRAQKVLSEAAKALKSCKKNG